MKNFFSSKNISNVKKLKLVLYMVLLALAPISTWLSYNVWVAFMAGMFFVVISHEAIKLYDESKEIP
jgi:hypothetical protein